MVTISMLFKGLVHISLPTLCHPPCLIFSQTRSFPSRDVKKWYVYSYPHVKFWNHFGPLSLSYPLSLASSPQSPVYIVSLSISMPHSSHPSNSQLKNLHCSPFSCNLDQTPQTQTPRYFRTWLYSNKPNSVYTVLRKILKHHMVWTPRTLICQRPARYNTTVRCAQLKIR